MTPTGSAPAMRQCSAKTAPPLLSMKKSRPGVTPLAANWMTVELFGALNKEGKTLAESPVSPAALGALVALISDGTISGRIAKDVFAEMVETGGDPAVIVEEKA